MLRKKLRDNGQQGVALGQETPGADGPHTGVEAECFPPPSHREPALLTGLVSVVLAERRYQHLVCTEAERKRLQGQDGGWAVSRKSGRLYRPQLGMHRVCGECEVPVEMEPNKASRTPCLSAGLETNRGPRPAWLISGPLSAQHLDHTCWLPSRPNSVAWNVRRRSERPVLLWHAVRLGTWPSNPCWEASRGLIKSTEKTKSLGTSPPRK